MDRNSLKQVQFNFSGIGCWLTVLAGAWLLGALGLGWLVKSLVLLIILLLLAPIVALIVFRWWLQRNLVEGNCPVCQAPLTGMNGLQLICPSCGTALKVDHKAFQRITPEGTIDVEAIEVPAQSLEESSSDS